MWIDHGTIRMTGGIEEVVRAYEGDDAAHHVREILEENARETSAVTEFGLRRRRHPPAGRRVGPVPRAVTRADPRCPTT